MRLVLFLLLYTWFVFFVLCLLFLAIDAPYLANFFVGGLVCWGCFFGFSKLSQKFDLSQKDFPHAPIVTTCILALAVMSNTVAYSPSDFLRLLDGGTYEGTVAELAHDHSRGLWRLTDAKVDKKCTGRSSVYKSEGGYSYTYAQGIVSKNDPKVGVWLVGKKQFPTSISGVVGKSDEANRARREASGSKGCTISEDAPMLLQRSASYSQGLVLLTTLLWMFGMSILSVGVLKISK